MKNQHAVQKAEVAEEIIELGGKVKETVPSQHAPRVALLGWCDRAARIEGPHPAFTCTNIQGLNYSRVSNIFPFSLRGLTLAAALYNPIAGETINIQFRHSDGAKAFDLTMNLAKVQVFEQERNQYVDSAVTPQPLGWYLMTSQVANDVLVMKPDTLAAFLKSDGGEEFLGSFNLLHASLPLYSADQVAALRSDPLARRIVRIVYSCSECGAKLQTYAALERNRALEQEGCSWFADLGEEFRCKCGKLSFSLQYLRTGLHGLLSRNFTPDDQGACDYVRLYETTKLEDDCRQFKALLDKNVPEQELQDFLEAHPVFFARFSASRLIPKPKILTKYVADFGFVNRRKELQLVEIERAGMRLLTKDRRITAGLQHAVTQVTDWIQEVGDHKTAVLASLGIELKEVAVVRGVVIAGRSPSDDEEARSLRRAFTGNVDFYTYDDLLRDTTEIIRRVANA
jgi:hypothetical protein